MKTSTYAKLSKFVGKIEDDLNCAVTEYTEEKIFEYATNRFIAYRTIQDNYTGVKDAKILNNLKGTKNVSAYSCPNIHELFDSKTENNGTCDDILNLIKEFSKSKAVSGETFHLMLGEKEFYFNTKTLKPAFEFVKTLINDNTELEFTDSNLKLEYNSENEPLKITFFCLNALVVQVLIAPTRNRD